VGRWGTGKSAIAKKSVKLLVDKLKEIKEESKIWYIGEKDINAINSFALLYCVEQFPDSL
jgi:hypothetical protein